MLPLKIVEEVQRLLDEKCYSQRRIAQITGVSRGTIQAIACGKRGTHGREEHTVAVPAETIPVRCPGCGARVYLPCILCQARAFTRRREISKSPPRPRYVA